jgi:branched-chain amino acid transport system ATP-binding protein
MSGGEQQMLTVARTLMGNPLVVLLDEPSEGVSPIIVDAMAKMIEQIKKHGVSVLLSEQNFFFAQAVSDRVYVIEKGHIRFSGGMDKLSADESLRRRYLTA